MRLALCLLAGLAGLGAGCIPPPKDLEGRVDGVVTLDDVPLSGGKLDLVSEGGSLSVPIGPDGRFRVPTVPAGRYKVAVGPVPARQNASKVAGALRHGDNEAHDDPKASKGPSVPKKYQNPATSGLEVEVGGKAIPFDIKLTSK